MAAVRSLSSLRRSYSSYVIKVAHKQTRISNKIAWKVDVGSNTSKQNLPDTVYDENKVNQDSQPKKKKSFASLLRKSSLMMLGPLKEAKLRGKIMEVVEDDLYIDFGGKFYCVCPRPNPKREYYRGREVQILLHDWEMASKFIGSERHVTLLEADATLLGLWQPPMLEQESDHGKDFKDSNKTSISSNITKRNK